MNAATLYRRVFVGIFLAIIAILCLNILRAGFPDFKESYQETRAEQQAKVKSRPKPRPPEPHGFKLRPGEQWVIPNYGGLITQADWYDVYTIVLVDFGNSTKQYEGWKKSDIFISPMEMRRAKNFVFIRPTEAEFIAMLRSGAIKHSNPVPNPKVAGYDIMLGDFRN